MLSRIITVFAIMFTPIVLAETLDCSEHSDFVMNVVCTNEDVTTNHYYMESLLHTLHKKSPNNTSYESEQVEWLEKRNQCHDEGCIKALYTERIDELKNYIEGKGKVPYPNNLKLNQNPGICTNCKPEYLPEIISALKGRITITGDKAFCESVLTTRYFYPKIDYRRSLDIKMPRETKISEGTFLIDMDNDGTKERVVEIQMHSGRGEGCDQEYQQVVDDSITIIQDSHVNELLSPDSCGYYSKPFIYHDKVYIENRAARLSAVEIGVNWRHYDGVDSLLSDVYMINNLKLQHLCHYDYKYEKAPY